MSRKGIILAGGTGTRLYPSSIAVSKQLMPVYDKPMIYYPLSTLMECRIRDVLVITTPHDQAAFQTLLRDGSQWGISISYAEQASPDGIAQALIIAEDFLDGAPCALILGDNLFFGDSVKKAALIADAKPSGATIFAYYVNDPERYGVVKFNSAGQALALVEKPEVAESQYAVTGLYFYDNKAPDMARKLIPSARGELEITALNQMYLDASELDVQRLPRGTTWLDTGTHRSLFQAAQFVSVIQERQGRRICSLEEIAYTKKWITKEMFQAEIDRLGEGGYAQYLKTII
ncbi:glucose-1-phosphate thymidylyltransferase RfbA [Litorimonas sp. RW-G-Af-16]|uniref:glucose-1-phosphate thymidylyltransferase RfbA n=1 Tax=Litorimonas sp. RW-G-Af-16 TaxID=3241168 RepID=UPI00390C419C